MGGPSLSWQAGIWSLLSSGPPVSWGSFPRTELWGGISVQASARKGVIIYSDSKYFVDGAAADRVPKCAGPNGDLWAQWWRLFELRPYGALVLKGKAHGNAMQFASGLVAPWHYAGNAFADALRSLCLKRKSTR